MPITPAVSGETTPSSAAAEQRQLEPVRTERPGDVDVVRIARPSRRNDRDVVEAVRPTGLLSASDLYFHYGIVFLRADGSGEVVESGEERTIKSVAAAEIIVSLDR